MALLKVKVENANNTPTEVTKPKKDNLGRSYGTGRRKNATARVWIKAGTGAFVVNQRKIEDYFQVDTLCNKILLPFSILEMKGKFDVFCTVKGGGHSGQAGAVQLGIARALDKFEPEFHVALRKNGLLTRDSRIVERKKFGKHKARKSTQFSKR
jgi:small subunit ribosomal protein S9